MTHDDDTIRRLLTEAAPASHGVSAEAVARRAARVRRRRTALGVAVVPLATLATIGLAVGGVEILRGDPGPGPAGQPTQTLPTGDGRLIPWVDTPATAYVAPAASGSPTAPAPNVPACAASDLVASWGTAEGATGHVYHPLELTNSGEASCTVTGFPAVVATESGLPDVAAEPRDTPGDQPVVLLAPGDRAVVTLDTASLCEAHPGGGGQAIVYHSLELTLFGGGAVTVPRNSEGLDLKCGLGTSEVAPERGGESLVPPDPWRGLQVIAQTDDARMVDGDLVYEVDLVNTSDTDVSFADRCPSYVETLTSEPSGNVVAKESYQLNCAAAPVIPARTTVRYEMRLTTLDGVGGTPFTLTWALAMPNGPQGAGSLTVLDGATTSPTSGQAYEYTSPKGVLITLDDFPSGKTISSPVTITGEVPGTWSFEADFPVVLTDWDGKIIATGIGTLQGDWMTEDLVPFTVTLTFTTPTYKNTGSLILQKDNPSGDSKLDDAVEVPVTFGGAASGSTNTPGATAQLLDYTDLNGGGGAEVLPDGDTSQLNGAPQDFRDFIAGVAKQTGVDGQQCPSAYHGVHVSKVRTDGFAIGGVNDCGGYVAIWARVDGAWQLAIGTQELPQCEDLKKYAIPSEIVGNTCTNTSGRQVDYSQP